MRTGSGLIIGALVVSAAWLQIVGQGEQAGAVALCAFIACFVFG